MMAEWLSIEMVIPWSRVRVMPGPGGSVQPSPSDHGMPDLNYMYAASDYGLGHHGASRDKQESCIAAATINNIRPCH